MKRVSVTRLKARLAHYLRAVRRGQEIIITDQGTPVARLCPVNSEPLSPDDQRPALDDRLRALIAAGLARPPQQPLPAEFWEYPRPADPQARALASLDEDRADRS